jgi:hypothetical protein
MEVRLITALFYFMRSVYCTFNKILRNEFKRTAYYRILYLFSKQGS